VGNNPGAKQNLPKGMWLGVKGYQPILTPTIGRLSFSSAGRQPLFKRGFKNNKNEIADAILRSLADLSRKRISILLKE
jgi:hypothetical protein